MTGSEAVNKYAIESFSNNFGEQGSYRLATSEEIKNPNLSIEEQQILFNPKGDYINLSEAFRENPKIYEVEINTEEEYKTMVSRLFNEFKSVLLFIRKDDKLYLIPEFEKTELTKEDCTLIYLGKNV
jgi:hypothetical protein